VPDLPTVAQRLADGNTLLSWGAGVTEVTPDHAVVWELTADELACTVTNFGGCQRLTNGNTLVANSDWHHEGDNYHQLIEVDRDKRVVWSLSTDDFEGRKPGSFEPATGNVEHRIIALQTTP
jgi:hypothetical protein